MLVAPKYKPWLRHTNINIPEPGRSNMAVITLFGVPATGVWCFKRLRQGREFRAHGSGFRSQRLPQDVNHLKPDSLNLRTHGAPDYLQCSGLCLNSVVFTPNRVGKKGQ